jgi:hypothetical protein
MLSERMGLVLMGSLCVPFLIASCLLDHVQGTRTTTSLKPLTRSGGLCAPTLP